MRWVADLAQFPTRQGPLHVAAIRDLCHRGIVGWAMDALDTRDEAKLFLFEHIEIFYNRQRHQTALGHMTPVEYAAARAIVSYIVSYSDLPQDGCLATHAASLYRPPLRRDG